MCVQIGREGFERTVRGWRAMWGRELALRGVSAGALWALLLATPAQAARPPIFVLNSQDATINVIDPDSWGVTQRIATGKEPHHLYLTPDEKSVIVANAANDSLTFIDPRTAEVQRVEIGRAHV